MENTSHRTGTTAARQRCGTGDLASLLVFLPSFRGALRSSLVAHTCGLSARQIEAKRSGVYGYPLLLELNEDPVSKKGGEKKEERLCLF